MHGYKYVHIMYKYDMYEIFVKQNAKCHVSPKTKQIQMLQQNCICFVSMMTGYVAVNVWLLNILGKLYELIFELKTEGESLITCTWNRLL